MKPGLRRPISIYVCVLSPIRSPLLGGSRVVLGRRVVHLLVIDVLGRVVVLPVLLAVPAVLVSPPDLRRMTHCFEFRNMGSRTELTGHLIVRAYTSEQ